MPSSTLEQARALADLDVPAPSRASAQEFALGGAIPRAEPQERRGFKSQDVFLRLENKVYGPLTQEELGDLLESGQLTGFESASSDLRTWTPLIYHPRMTLNGQIDPDATHDLLHGRSDLPAAGSRPVSVNLEELADLEENEELPGTPLAAILIMPSGPLATPKTLAPKKSAPAKAATSLDAPVFADLDQEDLDEVIVRSGVPADDADDQLADTSENIPTEEAKAEPPPAPVAPPPAPPAPVAAAASPPPPPEPAAEAPASSAEPDDAGSTMSLSPVEAMQVLADIGAAIPPAPPIDILDDDYDPLPVDASAFGDTIERAVIQDDGDDEENEDDADAAAVTAPIDVGEPSQEAAQGEQSASAPEEEDDGGNATTEPLPAQQSVNEQPEASDGERPNRRGRKKPPAGIARAEGTYTSENSELIFFTSEHEAVKRASEEVEVKEERIGPSNKHYLAAMIVLLVVALAAVIFLTDIFNLTG